MSVKKALIFLLSFVAVIAGEIYCYFLDSNEAVEDITASGIHSEKQEMQTKQVVTATETKVIDNKIVQKKEHELSILIEKGKFKLSLLDNGDVVKTYACALGKNVGQKIKSGDMKTPIGIFVVDEIIDASAWTHDFHDGKGEIAGAYGPWFISLDTSKLSKGKWDGIGIHGTHDPRSIGTLASEGCIRLHNEDIRELKKYVYVGMQVEIRE